MEANQREIHLVIGITGLLGAGKTTAAENLVSELGFSYIRYSQVLADWFKENPDHKDHLQVIGWDVMSGGQQIELNRRLIAKMSTHNDWCVDGLRHILDYQNLRSKFASRFHLVYIDCPQEERWARLQKKSRFQTYEQFCIADAHPVEQQILTIKQFADIRISNVGPIQDLSRELSEFISSLRKGDL